MFFNILVLFIILFFTPTNYQEYSNKIDIKEYNLVTSSKTLSAAREASSGGEYHCQANTAYGLNNFRAMQEYYYEPSPSEFCGFATRYGSATSSINELYWEAQQVVEQFRFGYVMLGGNYGFQIIGGKEYLLDNRASRGYELQILSEQPQILTEAQMRLYTLGKMEREEFINYVITNYIGVISIKSPNDIGREFCLYDANDGEQMGTVIVGGTAAAHDWLPIGYRANPETISLGLMSYEDSEGQEWFWSVDLPNHLYYIMEENGNHPHVKLVSGRCEINNHNEKVME